MLRVCKTCLDMLFLFTWFCIGCLCRIVLESEISFHLSCHVNKIRVCSCFFLQSATKSHAYEKETSKPFTSPLFEIKSNFNSKDKVEFLEFTYELRRIKIVSFHQGFIYTSHENTNLIWPVTFFCQLVSARVSESLIPHCRPVIFIRKSGKLYQLQRQSSNLTGSACVLATGS